METVLKSLFVAGAMLLSFAAQVLVIVTAIWVSRLLGLL